MISVPGELRPFEEVRLFAKASGFVRDIAVDRGSRVHRGEILAHLDAPELAAQVAEAGARTQAADAALSEAEARYAGSRATYERIRTAARTDGVIAPDEVERARAIAVADSARLASTRSQANATRSAQRAVKELESYLVVTAPFDGIITERNVHPGALVGPASGAGSIPMLRLQDESRLRLAVSLPESYVGAIPEHGVASFQVRAFPADTFHAALGRTAGALDIQTRAEILEFDVPNARGRLKAGMYADVLVPVTRPASTVLVPASAVATSVGGPFVIVVVGDTAHWVQVRKGDVVGNRVEVYGALHRGDRVAVHGTEEIRSGTRVHPVAEHASRGAPGRGRS